MNPVQRKKALTSLIEDCKKAGVTAKVIKGFEKQLKEVDKEIALDKKKRQAWRKQAKKEGEEPSNNQELIIVEKRAMDCVGSTIRGLGQQVIQLEGMVGK